MMSLALAVSCTPGNCTTTRSSALLLDHRLGHAEFVDAVVQRGDVLLERLVLHRRAASGLSVPVSLKSPPSARLGPVQVGQLVGEQAACAASSVGAVAEAHLDAVAVAA